MKGGERASTVVHGRRGGFERCDDGGGLIGSVGHASGEDIRCQECSRIPGSL